MLRPGDFLAHKTRGLIGYVLRLDGTEACIVLRPGGKEERWNVRIDELPESVLGPADFGCYKKEVHTVADLIEVLACFKPDTVLEMVDGNRGDSPQMYLHRNHVRGDGGPWDLLSLQFGC